MTATPSHTIVCYGDSITWGYDPATGTRLPKPLRWTSVLQRALGETCEIVAEGLVNRTTNLDDPVCPDRNGLQQLAPILDSHKPVSAVILMLGTNDLKARFNRSATDIAESAARVAGVARNVISGSSGQMGKVFLVAPPPVLETGVYREMYVGGAAKSRELGPLYERYAAWVGAIPFDAGTVSSPSEADGVHPDAASHQSLGEALAALVRSAA